ncbi:amidase [Acuticoccus kandeliae]|uniref:amidase n=1 Tax=Acuticoccus kandeliae TaxID=2073160 RepID=UPI000D3E3323|nr:amidase [Acuticoccus kandeliae]
MTALHALTAGELAALYSDGTTRPSEALAAILARYERVNPVLNAVVTLDVEGATAAAREADGRWADGQPLSPLDGVPVTIKDNLKVGGLRATWGSRAYADHVAPRDELAVARLRAAGAVILGKTNTPELALAGFTSNELFGVTGNPWDPALTPGGSSGGAVAAVMGGIAPLALATDAGGSVRRPAGHAGAVGLRTTPGLIPRRDGFPALATDLQTIGPIARTTTDLAAMLAILSATTPPAPSAALAGLRVGLVGRIGAHPLDPEILSRLGDVAALLTDAGASVAPLEEPWDPEEAGALFMGLAAVGVAATLEDALAGGFTPSPAIARLAETGAAIDGKTYARTLAAIADYRWRAADLFEAFDIILSPSSAALPWPKATPFPETIDGITAAPRASAIYTTFANVAGLPALAFPAAPAANGMPIGMQLIGAAGADWRLLEIGAALEAMIAWPRLAPDVRVLGG